MKEIADSISLALLGCCVFFETYKDSGIKDDRQFAAPFRLHMPAHDFLPYRVFIILAQRILGTLLPLASNHALFARSVLRMSILLKI